MEKPIVVITTDTKLSPKITLGGSHAMDPRDVHCARHTKMEEQIVVITTDIRLSPKITLAGSPATDPRDVRCVRLISKMFFLGWGNHSGFIG
jgi:hypothetical protein